MRFSVKKIDKSKRLQVQKRRLRSLNKTVGKTNNFTNHL